MMERQSTKDPNSDQLDIEDYRRIFEKSFLEFDKSILSNEDKFDA